MIKLKARQENIPELMLSPMIDMVFLLLVFFIISTMYMSEVHTVPVRLPVATQSQTQSKVKFIVTIKKDNSLWLEDKAVNEKELLAQAVTELSVDKDFTVIIRSDGDVSYKKVIALLDRFKEKGIVRVGLATDKG